MTIHDTLAAKILYLSSISVYGIMSRVYGV